MGLLDDAIREHLELKRRHGASPEEVERQEQEALGPARRGEFARPEPEPELAEEELPADEPPPAEEAAVEEAAVEASPVAPPPVPTEEPAPAAEPWLDEPDEVPAEDALEHRAAPEEEEAPPPAVPGGEDVLEETPEFLQETPEHDRLWFEQKPPRDFDFDK
jgi:hypothetical protein